jgi:hypothetical protein
MTREKVFFEPDASIIAKLLEDLSVYV